MSRVESATKAGVPELIDSATAASWEHRRACACLQLGEARGWRWRERRAAGTLADPRPGGHAVHGLLDAEHDAIIALYDDWGEVDRSHRKLAHRGCYERRVWVSPSTVMRVLAAHGTSLHDRWLAEQMKDLEFRAEYERERREIAIIDEIVNSLDQLRTELGFSKAELAREIGKNPASIRRLLTAPGNPELRTIVAMADVLDADIKVVPRKRSARRTKAKRPATPVA